MKSAETFLCCIFAPSGLCDPALLENFLRMWPMILLEKSLKPRGISIAKVQRDRELVLVIWDKIKSEEDDDEHDMQNGSRHVQPLL